MNEELELATQSAAVALRFPTTATTTIKLPPSPISASLSKVLVADAKDSSSRQLVTFSQSNSKGANRRSLARTNNDTTNTVPKSSLESINSRCSLSSVNDDSLATSQHQRMDSSRAQSADVIQTISSHRLDGVESKPSYLLEPSDDLSWRPSNNNTDSFNFGVEVGGGDSHLGACRMPPEHLEYAVGHSDKRLRSMEDGEFPPEDLARGSDLSSLNAEVVSEKSQPPFMFAGIVASILGSIFFSLAFLCVKLLPDNSFVGNARTLSLRGLVISTCSGLTILYRNSTFLVKRDELWVNFLRSLFGTLAIYGAYCSMMYISMGDSTALVFSSPIWTSILSHFILKEPIQWSQLVALPASIFGIVLIAHPALIVDVDHLAIAPAQHLLLANQSATGVSRETLIEGELAEYQHRWPGIVIALCTSFCVSGTYIVLKFRKSTPIQTTTFWLGSTMTMASALVLAIAGQAELPAEPYEWALLVVNGVFSWLGQCVLQWAFSFESASILSVVRTLDVALTFVLSALFLDEEIYWTSIVGATIIGLVVASIVLNNYLKGCACSSGAEELAAGGQQESPSAKVVAKSYQAAGFEDSTGRKLA